MSRRIDLSRKPDNSNFHMNRPRPFLYEDNEINDNEELPEEEVNEKNSNEYTDNNNYYGEDNTNEINDDRYMPSRPSIRQSIANAIGRRRDASNDNIAPIGSDITETAKKEAKSELAKIAIKNPVVRRFLIIGGLIMLMVLFVIILIASIGGSSTSRNYYGLSGYSYYPGGCSQVQLPDGTLLELEDYVAGVISREVTGFDFEVLKSSAVAARTYVMKEENKVGDDTATCYYNVTSTTSTFQVYSPTTVEKYHDAANETRGLIITVDGARAGAHYDASCVYTAEQAREIDPTGNFTSDNYYIKYGAWDIGGINFQPIPVEDADKFHGSFRHYATFADNGSPCHGNHGGGISQNGSAYLNTIQGYTWEEIINYYYNGKAEIMSIYRGLSYSGDYPLDPNDPLYKSVEYFKYDVAFKDFLEENGTSISEFNENLKASIEEAGVGTREASVAVALTTIGSLAEMGIKLPYDWGGNYYNLGANPNWGVIYDNSAICASYPYMSGPDYCMTNYKWRGFDCAGFVNWAVKNAMQDTSISRLYTSMPGEELSSSYPVCDPGGVLVNGGHIVLVVAIDDENNRYIIAESTGSAGLRLSYMSYNEGGYGCNNLNDLYGD